MSQHDQELRDAFVYWYVTPEDERTPRFRKGFAEEFGVPDRTLYEWEHSQWFREAVEKLYGKLNLSPDRIQKVVDAMWSAACTGSTQAASLYLQYIDRLNPNRASVVEDRSVEDMSDEELAAALREQADAIQSA